ncbi:MAG: AAA family ATPase [Bacteroidales bacterium]|nr:AAA family ATPase [Bacteroidales bacterium]
MPEMRITLDNFRRIWESILIRATDKYVTPPEVIRVGTSTIGTLGNFSASTGKGKSKKTFNVCAIVASAISGRKVLNYESCFPADKKRILYFDTEQSSFHCHKVLERINCLAGLPAEQDCDLIEFVMLREYGPLERRQIIELALAERPGVGLVIIDGLRDLLYDINSSNESAEVIGLLMKWSSQYNLHIHTVLHLNKGDDNVRGHIGTELNHKAETVLQISKNEMDGSMSEVHASLIRDRDFPPFAFRINPQGLPELVEDFDPRPKAKLKIFDYENMDEDLHKKALGVAFGSTDGPFAFSPLIDRLTVGYATIGYDRSRNVHIKFLKFLLKNGIVRKEGKDYFYNRDFHYIPLNCR